MSQNVNKKFAIIATATLEGMRYYFNADRVDSVIAITVVLGAEAYRRQYYSKCQRSTAIGHKPERQYGFKDTIILVGETGPTYRLWQLRQEKLIKLSRFGKCCSYLRMPLH